MIQQKYKKTEDDNNKSKLVLFAYDTSLIMTSSNHPNFMKDINGVFTHINYCFKTNFLSLILKKNSLIQFLTKNRSRIPISVGCDNNIKSNITSINC
jgi:hypothetical protein